MPALGWALGANARAYALVAFVWVVFCSARLFRRLPTAIFVPDPAHADSADFASALAQCFARAQNGEIVRLAIDASLAPASHGWTLTYERARGIVAGRHGRALARVEGEGAWIADHPCPLNLRGGQVARLTFRAVSPTRVRVG